jgi:alpha-tubulin suppressor-like RCC1 family protein
MPFFCDWSTRAKFIFAIAILIGCGGDATAPDPTPTQKPVVTPTLHIQSSASQSATVGTAAPQNPSVLVTDNHGAHPAGLSVTFVPDSGSGSVAMPTGTTDSLGVASAGVWTVGTRAHIQHMTASVTVSGTVLHADFSVTATAAGPALMRIASGDKQDGPYGATLVTPVKVVVTDRYGNPTPSVTVRFGVDTGGVTAATVTTDIDGSASTRVRLPRTIGQITLSAAADSVPGITGTLTSRGIHFASFSIDAGIMCGLSVEGYPYCWGANPAAELLPIASRAGENVYTPQPINADLSLTSISLGGSGGCGVRTDGTAVCWGNNMYGANGDGHSVNNTTVQFDSLTAVAGSLSFVEVDRGYSTTCGTTKTGQSYCWGDNEYGQAGVASLYNYLITRPTLIDGGITFHSYALGTLHSCALDPAGKAYCWGMDLDGRLGVVSGGVACANVVIASGRTTTTPSTCASSPVAVNTVVRFTSLASASDATCGLDAGGTTYCWGSNDFVQLGTGDGAPPDTVPTQVPGAPSFKQLSGHDRGFCGLTNGGEIYCWGYVSQNLGVPPQACVAFSDCTPKATKVSVGRLFSSITFTTGQLCGLSDGTAYCWGTAANGSLGIGQTGQLTVSTPTQITGQGP